MTIRNSFAVAALAAVLSTSALAGPFQQGENGHGTGIALTPSTQALEFDAYLPLNNQAALKALIVAQTTPGSASYHQWLTPEQFAATYGPTPDQTSAATAAFRALGLSVTAIGPRSLHVTGTAAQVQAAFATQLRTVTNTSGATRVIAAGPLALSPALKAVGAMIPAFENVPEMKPASGTIGIVPDNRYAPRGPLWFTDLKQAYDYPSYQATRGGVKVDGTGASVAILMSGDVSDTDTKRAFDHELFTATSGTPVPTVLRLPINGGAKYDPNGGGTFEATLDVQEVTGGAPGATTTLVTIPSLSGNNILAGYTAIVSANTYDIVSSSFGGPENFYLPGLNGGMDFTYILDVYDSLFQQGNAQGITFIASSGDEGGLGCPSLSYFNPTPGAHSLFVPCIDQPADSPHVTALGGGNLITSTVTPDPANPADPANFQSTYVSENGLGDPEVPHDPYGFGQKTVGGYWGAGGGISQHYLKPDYQGLVASGSPTYRTLPDIGMLVGGCPRGLAKTPCGKNGDRSAALISLGFGAVPPGVKPIPAGNYGVIGTSVAAPEFAGALALYVGQNGRQGNLNGFLYAAAAAQAAGGPAAFHQTHKSFDGYWHDHDQGGPYDYIFGAGSPDVRVLFGFTDLAPAGNPKTPTNP